SGGDGECPIDAEDVARLAHGPDNIVGGAFATGRLVNGNDVVPGAIERGADQLAHRRVDDREALGLDELQVFDAREEESGVAGDRPPRLEQQLQAAPSKA